MGKQIDLGKSNPRMQCDICGKWMRLHGRNEDGPFQRFFAGYKTKDGKDIPHDKDVCVTCESLIPGWEPYPHPMVRPVPMSKLS